MKHIFFVLIGLYSYSLLAQSCCTSQPCAISVGADGIEDANKNSKVGIGYQLVSDKFSLYPSAEEVHNVHYQNLYHTTTINAKIGITPRLFLIGYLPFRINHVNANDNIHNYSGLSDVKIGWGGIVWKQQKPKFKQQLELSSDVLFPTGKYYKTNNLAWNSMVVSPGNGAFALTFKASYKGSFKHFTYAGILSYNQTFANQEKLRLGNHLNGEIHYNQLFSIHKCIFLPGVLIGADYFSKNKLDKKIVPLSGGLLVKAGITAIFKWKQFETSAGWNFPLYQSIAYNRYQIKQVGYLQFNYLFRIHKQQKTIKK
jgi:hypothetical protein